MISAMEGVCLLKVFRATLDDWFFVASLTWLRLGILLSCELRFLLKIVPPLVPSVVEGFS